MGLALTLLQAKQAELTSTIATKQSNLDAYTTQVQNYTSELSQLRQDLADVNAAIQRLSPKP